MTFVTTTLAAGGPTVLDIRPGGSSWVTGTMVMMEEEDLMRPVGWCPQSAPTQRLVLTAGGWSRGKHSWQV